MQDISKSILATAVEPSYLVYRLGWRRGSPDQLLRTLIQSLTELRNCEILTPFLSVHLLSLIVLKFAICAWVYSVCLHDFHKKNNEINESHKLCQVRGKHTVGA